MKDNLIVGCSHVEGFELEEELNLDAYNLDPSLYDEVVDYRLNHSFPYYLFTKLNQSYESVHMTGADNSWITYNTIKYINETPIKPQNVIICLSGVTRQQRYYNNHPHFFNPLYPGHAKDFIPFSSKEEKENIVKWEKVESEVFFNIDYYNIQTYHYVNYLKLFLEKKNINYFFLKSVNSDINLFEFTNNTLDIAFKDFYEKGGYKIAKGGHSLSDGHSAWADYIYNNLKNNFK